MTTRWEFIKLALILLGVACLNQKWRDKFVKDLIEKMLEEINGKDKVH